MSRHPARRHLAAAADGTLPWWRQLSVRPHLRTCARCQEIVAEHQADALAVSALLGGAAGAVDVEHAMGRVLVRAGKGSTRPSRVAWGGWVAATAAIAMVLLVVSNDAKGDGRWNEDLRWLMNPDSAEAKEVRLDDQQFVRRLFDLEKKGVVTVVTDHCCDDRDGEGPADDGLMYLTLAETETGLAVIYEDMDQSSSLSAGDLIRLVSRTRPPSITLERHGPTFRPGSLPLQ